MFTTEEGWEEWWIVLGRRPCSTERALRSRRPGRAAATQKPEILTRTQPRYPEYARADRVQGKVAVEAIITSTGVPRNLALLTPDALPGMEANALDTLCDWRFKPASYRGGPVPVYYRLTINFEIRQ